MSKSNKLSKRAQSTKKSSKTATAKKATKTVSAKAETKKAASKAAPKQTTRHPKTRTKFTAMAETLTKAAPAETVAEEAAALLPGSANSRARALVLDQADPKKAIAALQRFGSTQLQRVFGDLFGAETTSRNVMYLRSAISKGLLDQAAGIPLAAPAEEKKAARNKVVTEPKPKEPRPRDPRLPAVGTTILQCVPPSISPTATTGETTLASRHFPHHRQRPTGVTLLGTQATMVMGAHPG